MTLENCKRMLKHFEDTKQTARAEEMKAHIAQKEKALGVSSGSKKK